MINIPTYDYELERSAISRKKEVEKNKFYNIDSIVAYRYIEWLEDHIRFVIRAGKGLGVPDDQLINHDASKWDEPEFTAYAKHFQGGGNPDLFIEMRLHHVHNNPHHWQYWEFPEGVMEMPHNYALEMVANWIGTKMKFTGRWDITKWLINNIGSINIHPNTAKYVNGVLNELGYKEIVDTYNFASNSEH